MPTRTLPLENPAELTPGWAALTIIGLGIFSIILVKEAYDVGHAQQWW